MEVLYGGPLQLRFQQIHSHHIRASDVRIQVQLISMKALIYKGPGRIALKERADPEITAPTDAIVRVASTTICGTDLLSFPGCPDLSTGTCPGARGRRCSGRDWRWLQGSAA